MEYAERLHILKDTKNVIKSIMMYEKIRRRSYKPSNGRTSCCGAFYKNVRLCLYLIIVTDFAVIHLMSILCLIRNVSPPPL